jgi:serine/threonine-protein kinase
MGSVWHAFDTRLDIACAVKFIEGELANVAEAHARFEREAKAAAALRSPHVVEIKDHGVWQGTPYIAMELLDGEDLGKMLARAGGKLPPAQVSVVIEQVCRALTKAHQAGIVHRDLKPDNVFIVNDDDRQLVKILDFGVAKSTTGALDGSNTKTGAMLGTPYYMSPEQAQGIKSVDARSDLWSLAVIVFQCITGRLPFESEALGDLLVKIIVQPIPVPSQYALVPPGFDPWWAKAAERNPDARFQTAKELASSLSLALGTSTLSGGHELPSSPNVFVGTAMTGPGPALAVTPNPYAGAQPTSNPQLRTPPPGHPTPPGVVMPPANFPSQNTAPNQATFSGVEPPVTIPKRGPSPGLIAGLLFVLLAVGGAGVFVARRASTAVAGAATVSATAVATSTASAVESAAPSAEPAASERPAAPEAASASASAQPATSASAMARAGEHGGAKPTSTAGGASPGVATGTTATKAPATAYKPPTAPTTKKDRLGF